MSRFLPPPAAPSALPLALPGSPPPQCQALTLASPERLSPGAHVGGRIGPGAGAACRDPWPCLAPKPALGPPWAQHSDCPGLRHVHLCPWPGRRPRWEHCQVPCGLFLPFGPLAPLSPPLLSLLAEDSRSLVLSWPVTFVVSGGDTMPAGGHVGPMLWPRCSLVCPQP